MSNFGSTLGFADIYPVSATIAPGAQTPDIQQASGKVPQDAPSVNPGLAILVILAGLVGLRVLWERGGKGD